MKIGHLGSSDRVIIWLSRRHGIYASFRLARTRGFWLAFGPGYINRAGLR